MILLSLVAVVASIADVTLTLRLVLYGYGEEVNPLMRWAVGSGPFTAYFLALLMTAIVGAISCYLIGSGYAAYGWALLILLVLVRVGSAAWNYSLWRRI